MESVYLLQHLHIINDDEEDVKVIGIYKTREDALNAIDRINKKPGFIDFPKLINPDEDNEKNGFYIDEYELGLDNWIEGFETV